VTEIAGIRFSAQPPPGLDLLLDDPRYAPFREEGPLGPGRIEVPIDLVPDEGPDIGGLPLTFDSGGPWRAHRDGPDLLLEFSTGPGRDGRLWLARLAPGIARVRLHCGRLLARRRGSRVESPLHYPLDQLLMMLLLPHHRGVLLHTAGISRGDSAVILPGRSGAGKSTLMNLLANANGLAGLSDDRVVVREIEGALRAFGTPWAGTEPVVSRNSAELRAVAFLHQAPETRLRPIEPREALGQLLQTASIPWFDAESTTRSLAVCDALLERVPLYELHFRKDEEVAKVVCEIL